MDQKLTGFSLDSAAGNETLLLILDVYFAQAFVTGHCHLIRCSGKYHNLLSNKSKCEAGEIKKPTMELPGVNKKQAPLLAKETVGRGSVVFTIFTCTRSRECSLPPWLRPRVAPPCSHFVAANHSAKPLITTTLATSPCWYSALLFIK